MIARIVSFALQQRFLIVIASLALMVWARSPSSICRLTPIRISRRRTWKSSRSGPATRPRSRTAGYHSARNRDERHSAAGYAALDLALRPFRHRDEFEYGADPYFVREQAFERMADASVPRFAALYLAVIQPQRPDLPLRLQSPDRSPQDLKVIEDWVLERHYRSIQGVADDSGFGGTDMQYQVLLDPNKLFSYGVTVRKLHSN